MSIVRRVLPDEINNPIWFVIGRVMNDCNYYYKNYYDTDTFDAQEVYPGIFIGSLSSSMNLAELKKNGLYEDYLMHARKGNIEFFISQLEQELKDMINSEDSFVTEQGDIETWKVNKSKTKQLYTEKFQEFITYLKSKVE